MRGQSFLTIGFGGRWLQLDDDLLEQQRQAYAVQGVDETEPVAQPGKKRKKNNDEPHNVRAHSPSRPRVHGA